jgi:hypothetical protein
MLKVSQKALRGAFSGNPHYLARIRALMPAFEKEIACSILLGTKEPRWFTCAFMALYRAAQLDEGNGIRSMAQEGWFALPGVKGHAELALSAAARAGQQDATAALLDVLAVDKTVTPWMESAILASAAGGWCGVLTLLLRFARARGALPMKPKHADWTLLPLHRACTAGSLTSAQLLVVAGYDPLQADTGGHTALSLTLPWLERETNAGTSPRGNRGNFAQVVQFLHQFQGRSSSVSSA